MKGDPNCQIFSYGSSKLMGGEPSLMRSVFEDGQKNLAAANQAAEKLGNNPKPFEVMVEL